ncbi:hypothetical protein FQR65_LT17258 [Abscondita terminalis]|nr:hypothetical protein FQR65_LT17258 [Abscondita terminalis]
MGVTRTQALRLASDEFVTKIDPSKVVTLLETASERKLPIMVFVGNRGIIPNPYRRSKQSVVVQYLDQCNGSLTSSYLKTPKMPEHGWLRYFNIIEHLYKLKQDILDTENIPVSVGIAPTKTLAKIANRIAKKSPKKFNGLFILEKPEDIEKALKWLNIEDVWGIGRRLGARMKDAGIYKAYDCLNKPNNDTKSK